MKLKFWTYKGFSTVCFVISMALFLLSMLEIFSDSRIDNIAQRTGRIVESRLETLEGFIETDGHMPEGQVQKRKKRRRIFEERIKLQILLMIQN